MSSRKASLQIVREGNPGHHSAERLAGGVAMPAEAPPEPDWREWFPVIRVPTMKQLRTRVWPMAVAAVGGMLIADETHFDEIVKKKVEAYAKAERARMEERRDQARRCREVARREWRNVVLQLDAQNLLTLVDTAVLVDYTRTWARMDQCERDISMNGIWVPGERGAQKNPSTTLVNQLRGQLRFYVGQLGLSPIARDQLNPKAGDDGDESPFD